MVLLALNMVKADGSAVSVQAWLKKAIALSKW